MVFRLSINSNNPKLQENVPSVPVGRPRNGQHVVKGQDPHTPSPPTTDERIATNFTQEEATGFLSDLRGGRHS